MLFRWADHGKLLLRLLSVFICFLLPVSSLASENFDILIRGGQVYDGSGGAPIKADIGIKDGVIVFVGDAGRKSAGQTIEAAGLAVSPGFIDPHNHADLALNKEDGRSVANFVFQGVTTAVGGPDGWYPPAFLKQFARDFADGGLAINFALYVGHNGIRREVMGAASRMPTPEELDRMMAMVREGMELGAVGLSTGLMYEPGLFSDTDEVVALAKEVAPFGGIYDSHVRAPVKAFIESHKEAMEIGRRAGIPVKLGHLKGVGLHNKGRIREIIDLVESARARGETVVSDQYPYDGAATASLEALFVVPPTLKKEEAISRARLISMLENEAARVEIKSASENGWEGGFAWLRATGYNAIRVVVADGFPDVEGKYLSEIAEEQGGDPFDALVSLFIKSSQPLIVTLGAIVEQDVRDLMVQPWNMICSDGEFVPPNFDASGTSLHPRSTGSFPRFLGHYVRDLGLLNLPEAVRKITSLPADFLNLNDRGRIAVGKVADVVVFDPSRIADRSTWGDPAAFSVGIVHVIVNGVPVLKDSSDTGARPGKYVRRAE